MSVTDIPEHTQEPAPSPDDLPQSLATQAARQLATTTKSVPQMQGITSRWLLRVLPWTEVHSGTYRVNRKVMQTFGDNRINVLKTGSQVEMIPGEMRKLAFFHAYDPGAEVLREIAGQFEQREFAPGEVVAREGQPVDRIFVIAHGRVGRVTTGKYGREVNLGVLADGDHFGHRADPDSEWPCTYTAQTACTAMSLTRQTFMRICERTPELLEHFRRYVATEPPDNRGENAIAMSAGHIGEAALPSGYMDYEVGPREYPLSVAQTIMRVHTRVADLYNEPMDQREQQLRLTVEALRERQEFELFNNAEFGLLHNADYDQRIHSHSGVPTPDDLDDLLSRHRDPEFLFAHPQAISAFRRECNKRGLYPPPIEFQGRNVASWRGLPMLPSGKIPVTDEGTSSILVLRTGDELQGVVGLHQTGIPDEIEPGLSARFMGLDEQAVASYLVSAYYSAAILVPDAVGILEDVAVATPHS